MDGILLVSYIRKNMEEGMNTHSAIIDAGETRMRQIFMTGLSACIGLVPAAFSTGIGSQVQQPLAWVIVGGMLHLADLQPAGDSGDGAAHDAECARFDDAASSSTARSRQSRGSADLTGSKLRIAPKVG